MEEVINTKEKTGHLPENTQSNKAYEFILNKIKTGEWVSGEKIYTEKELCEELNLSRISVRAALDKLDVLGIIEKKKGAGTYVAEIDLNNIISNIVPLMTLKPMDLFDVLRFRLYFEPGNVNEFMKNHDPGDVEELKETYEQMKNHVDDNEEFYLADLRFHTIIARGTKNPIVISIYEMLTGIMVSSMNQTYSKVGPEIGLKYHADIISAMERGDSEMAALLMSRHIKENIDQIRKTRANDLKI